MKRKVQAEIPMGVGAEGHPEMLSGPAYHDSIPGPEPKPMEDLAGPFLRPQQAEPFWDKPSKVIEVFQIKPYYLGKERKLDSRCPEPLRVKSNAENFDIDPELLDLIRAEVKESFTPEEIDAFETFKDFYSEVDVQHGYEEEWDKGLYKIYYKLVWNELKGKDMEKVEAKGGSDYEFFEDLQKVAEHSIDRETLDIMPDVVHDPKSLIDQVEKQLQKLKKASNKVKAHGAEEGRPEREAQKEANMEKLEIESPEQFGIKNKGLLVQMAEEHGIGDLLGYSFRTNKIEIIGTEKILLIDYDLKPLHTRDVIGIDLSAAEPEEMEEAEIEEEEPEESEETESTWAKIVESEMSSLDEVLEILSKLNLYHSAGFMSYSGRGMMGKHCLGIDMNTQDAKEFKESLKKAGIGFSSDSLGKDEVIYFRNIVDGYEGLLEDEEIESKKSEAASHRCEGCGVMMSAEEKEPVCKACYAELEEASITAEAEQFHIVDWANNVMFDDKKFGSFDEAESFLEEQLGESYETERGEYDVIPDKGSRESRYLDPNHPGSNSRKSL